MIDYQKTITSRLTDFQEFRGLPGGIRWLYLPDEPPVQSDIHGHGSCIASKIAGRTVGVAKNANLVIVKAVPRSGIMSPALFIAVWAVVARDIESAELRGRAVISISMGCKQAVLSEYREVRINGCS
jgi:subtilisin family serine protease